MKRLLWLAVLLCAGCSANSVAAPSRPEGDEPYTPTKMEWLVVSARASHPQTNLPVLYRSVESNTVLIGIAASAESSPVDVNAARELAVRNVETHVKRLGWSWVRIKTEN